LTFEFAHLSAVGVHRVLLDVTGLVELVDDDLGVTVRYEALDPYGDSDA
jgi:hypothetical protein